VDDLPPARREKYEQSGRNAKILVKNVTAPSPAAAAPPREPALSSSPA